MLRHLNFEPSFKLRWCRAQDLFASQILVGSRHHRSLKFLKL